MLPNLFNNNNHGDKEEAIKSLEATDPEVIFKKTFKSSPLWFAFVDFFKKNYQEVDNVREVTYSTNHVTYYFFKNNMNNDIRILRAESGCFHSMQDFVSMEDINKHIQEIEEEKQFFVSRETTESNQEKAKEWCDKKINSVKKVISTYEELTKSVKLKPKM